MIGLPLLWGENPDSLFQQEKKRGRNETKDVWERLRKSLGAVFDSRLTWAGQTGRMKEKSHPGVEMSDRLLGTEENICGCDWICV